MKIALICPSNILYMPYIENYRIALDNRNIDYDIINWDRAKTEEVSELVYRDKKIGHHRNVLDYYKCGRFVKRKLNSNSYDKLIVFGLRCLSSKLSYLV